MRARRLIRVTGIVQGVGFRPFVYRLALECGLTGFVLNDGEGVFIEAEGDPGALRGFERRLEEEAPAAARLDRLRSTSAPAAGYREFEIRASRVSAERTAHVSPDLAVCPECLEEMGRSDDRRYRYPFTNCTLCGPRFTIVRDVPYDRRWTTMARFEMCADCRGEYEDPLDRRFHAQPTACPRCGPAVSLLTAEGVRMPAPDPMAEARRLLRQGSLLAIKGIGGFHLACDATNELAVRALRNRKVREEKPFAVMAAGIDEVAACAEMDPAERALLEGVEAPIVLLRRREDGLRLPSSVAPGQEHLGFFLPYTPLHHLLFRPEPGEPPPARLLVMTSGNRSDEPIAYLDDDAVRRLGDIADYFLVHDRPIHLRCDDSVVRIFRGRPQILRRARGFVPRALHLPRPVPAHVLATGPHLKNTFALAKGFDCYVGPHVGDLENLETFRAFEEGIRHFGRLFDILPTVVAHDLHPDYLSTRHALSLGAEERIACQHHEAHIASVVGEHGLEEPVVGVALDGTGFGRDGTIWGGEFFVLRDRAFRRAAHFAPVPLAGGDRVTKEIWRSAAAYLRRALPTGGWIEAVSRIPGVSRPALDLVARMLERGLNAPLSSGAGRAFDAAAALVLPRATAAYEGQGPLELEQAAHRCPASSGLAGLPFRVDRSAPVWVLDFDAAFAELAVWAEAARPVSARARAVSEAAWRFHRGVADGVIEVAASLAEAGRIGACCLSGGVFQNRMLLAMVEDGLLGRGLEVYRNVEVPPNDGGISFGQVVLASWWAFGGDSGSSERSARRAASAQPRRAPSP